MPRSRSTFETIEASEQRSIRLISRSACQNAFSREIDVRCPAIVNDRFTGLLGAVPADWGWRYVAALLWRLVDIFSEILDSLIFDCEAFGCVW